MMPGTARQNATGANQDPDTDALDVALGRQIRARRVAQGLSLREMAARTDLSPSFLSQLERGLARPRITSLHRVARTLGTTAQALLASGDPRPYSLVRSNEGRSVDHDEQLPPGAVRSVVAGDRGLTAMEFRGVPLQFGQYYDHPGEELYLVVRGRVAVDLDGEMIELGPGDTLCYDGRVPHRSRVGAGADPDDVLVYLVTTREDVRDD